MTQDIKEELECPVCGNDLSSPKFDEPLSPLIKGVGYCQVCNARLILYVNGNYTIEFITKYGSGL